MEEQQFPSELITLPSKGLLYAEDSPLKKGEVEMKYMTAREEDILTNVNFIKNGTVLDKLIQSLMVDKFNYDDLLIGDKNAVLIAARILGYGADYEVMKSHPQTGQSEKVSIDLTSLNDKELDSSLINEGKNEFEFELPASKRTVTFKLLTHGDEKKITQELDGLKRLNREGFEGTTRLKHTIIAVDSNFDVKTVRDFVDKSLLARDARALRLYIKEISPDTELKVDLTYSDGYIEYNVPFPLGVDFFWPDVGV
tara:strand:- start:126 stop:887 length:762 start_codon:yes stop_codon:yes gene_type:complete